MRRSTARHRTPTRAGWRLWALIAVAVLAAAFAAPAAVKRGTAAAATPAFSFGVAGDLAASDSSTAGVLDAVRSSGTNLFFAVGDMSYSQVTPESAWCTYVTNHVGTSYPFEMLAGNHEDNGPDGLISNFIGCLPDRLGAAGDYGREYYVDYPPASPLVRFIMISPKLTFPPSTSAWSYSVGSKHYTWTANAIDSARAAGIPWVVVGLHMYCLSMVDYPCASGSDIMNLLLSKRVDLYVQAHDHGYSRSKQLVSGTTTCPAVQPGSYDPDCVANADPSSAYAAGAGTVIATVGTGGRSMNKEDPNNAQAPYFQTYMGTNANPTFGFLKVSVSTDTLSAQFVRGAGGSFTDAFTVTKPSSPSPSPTTTTGSPTPTPTTTSPSPSPTTSSSATTLTATADTWVGSDAPTTAHGSDPALYADGSPIKVVYLKFDTSALAGRALVSATLDVTTTSGAYSGSPAAQAVRAVADTSWSEATMTYGTRPAVGATAIGTLSGTVPSTTYRVTLDPAALSGQWGGLVSVAIDQTGGDAFYVGSRESATPPQLAVVTTP